TALEQGTKCDVEFRVVLPDGKRRWAASQGDVLRDEQGVPVRIAGTIMDITERKHQEQELRRHAFMFESLSDGVVVFGTDGRVVVPLKDSGGPSIAGVALHRDISERKQMQNRLLFADRMASVGTLAAGVAHEINNPLAFISANLAYMDEQFSELVRRIPDASI